MKKVSGKGFPEKVAGKVSGNILTSLGSSMDHGIRPWGTGKGFPEKFPSIAIKAETVIN